MNHALFALDMPPIGGGPAIFAGVVFLLVTAALAFVVFLILRKSLKMAYRLVIVGVILAIAIFGCIALSLLLEKKPQRRSTPRPIPTRSN